MTEEERLPQFDKHDVSFVQCFVYIVISFASLYVLVFDINPQILVTAITSIYIVDLFIARPDTAFHHICIITMVVVTSGSGSSSSIGTGSSSSIGIGDIATTMTPYFRVLFATEISSIFLNARRLMDMAEMRATAGFICNNHKRTNTMFIIRRINDVLFIVTFFKFRIVDMYQLLIANPNMYNAIAAMYLYLPHNAINPSVYFLYIGIYGLFAINVYWACLIVKNVYADFAHAGWIFDSPRSCEFLTQYTYAASVGFAIYVYTEDLLMPWQRICLICIDVAGISTLVVTSYRYHRICYNGIIAEGFKDFNVASTAKRRNAFASDIGAIKLRSLLCVCAKMLVAPVYRISVLNKVSCIGLSVLVNVATYIFGMREWFTPYFKAGDTNACHELFFFVSYSEKDKYTKDRKRYISILNGVGITLDTVLTSLFVDDVRVLAFHYTTFLVVVLISFLQPFGKMNHFWLHCALTILTMSLCRVNIESAIAL